MSLLKKMSLRDFTLHDLDALVQQLNEQDISVCITRKKVKNINFRMKCNRLNISAPSHIAEARIADALAERIPWVLSAHQSLIDKQRALPSIQQSQLTDGSLVTLWGDEYTLVFDANAAKPSEVNADKKRITLALSTAAATSADQPHVLLEYVYRHALAGQMSQLFEKWQPQVGQYARETRIKKMHTRWGSCNVKQKRVWLSLYLAQYPVQCTEYVIVHELCHLYEANHSPRFWAHVARAMPAYKTWHDYLKGKTNL